MWRKPKERKKKFENVRSMSCGYDKETGVISCELYGVEDFITEIDDINAIFIKKGELEEVTIFTPEIIEQYFPAREDELDINFDFNVDMICGVMEEVVKEYGDMKVKVLKCVKKKP